MSFVSPEKQQLILDLLLDRLSEQDFYSRYPTSQSEVSTSGATMLRRALEEEDRVAVEFGLYLGHRFGITPEYLDTLENLAAAPWHERHEDVVAGLAKLRSPSSATALRDAALLRPAYLSYDDAFSLARKAIHALKSIQTPEALEKLGEILRQAPSPISDYAKKALTQVADTGSSDELKSAARRLIDSSE